MASTNYKEAFALFDKRGTGAVPKESLADLLRACGQNPTLQEVDELLKTTGDELNYDEFTRILTRPGGFREPGPVEEYVSAFKIFDIKNTGYVGVGQLRYVLGNLGEKMTEEEIDELLQVVDTSSGEVDYRLLIETVLAN